MSVLGRNTAWQAEALADNGDHCDKTSKKRKKRKGSSRKLVAPAPPTAALADVTEDKATNRSSTPSHPSHGQKTLHKAKQRRLSADTTPKSARQKALPKQSAAHPSTAPGSTTLKPPPSPHSRSHGVSVFDDKSQASASSANQATTAADIDAKDERTHFVRTGRATNDGAETKPKEKKTNKKKKHKKMRMSSGSRQGPDITTGATATIAPDGGTSIGHGHASHSDVSSRGLPTALQHPFPTDPGDHCETPLRAYQDVEPILVEIASALGKSKSSLRILDPFYCDGAAARHLHSLGFKSAQNDNADWYERLRTGTVPVHDVLLTNPPYSGGHLRRILMHVAASSTPSLLLLPRYTHTEPYYESAVASSTHAPMFFVPRMRYAYISPMGLRGGRAIPVTPFESVWHLHMGALTGVVLAAWASSPSARASGTLFRDRAALLAAGNAKQICRTEGRQNPKARKRARKKIMAQRAMAGLSQ